MGYEYDDSMWPVVLFRFTGRLNDEEGHRYFRDSDALVSGCRSYASVMDGTTMLMPETELVRRQAHWIRDNREAMARVNQGVAFVTTSALIRGLIRAVLHFQPAPVPSATFTSLTEAVAWAQQQATGAPATATRNPRN